MDWKQNHKCIFFCHSFAWIYLKNWESNKEKKKSKLKRLQQNQYNTQKTRNKEARLPQTTGDESWKGEKFLLYLWPPSSYFLLYHSTHVLFCFVLFSFNFIVNFGFHSYVSNINRLQSNNYVSFWLFMMLLTKCISLNRDKFCHFVICLWREYRSHVGQQFLTIRSLYIMLNSTLFLNAQFYKRVY